MIQRLAALIFLTAGLTSPLLAGPEFWYEDNNMRVIHEGSLADSWHTF